MMRQENMNDLDDIIITKRIRKRYKSYFEKYKDDDVKYYIKYNFSFERLQEESLSRVWQHAQKGCALLSAFKKGRHIDYNMKMHIKLKKHIRTYGLGFFEVDGVYINKKGEEESELSIFVPYNPHKYTFDEFKKILVSFCKQYNQESILLKYPDTIDKGKAVYLYQSGEEEIIGYHVTYKEFVQAYSKLRYGSHAGRKFSFEGVRVPANHIEAYKLIKEGLIF